MAALISENAWRERMWDVVRQKCAVPDEQFGCIKWQGAVFQPGGYGKLAVQWTDQKRKYFRVHRLVYMLEHKLSEIPTQGSGGVRVEISHICHQKLCVQPDHLILESHETYMERMHCKMQGLCTKNHQPHCLLVSQ